MNFSIILSIILILLWIITSLSGSDWFWWIIILFPILVWIKVFPRFGLTDDSIKAILIIWGIWFIFIMTLLSEWVFNFGSIIIFIYLLLISMVLAKIFWTNKWIYALIIIFWIIISSVFTSLADDYMSEQLKISIAKEAENEKIMKDKIIANSKAKQMNLSWSINTGATIKFNTGTTIIWSPLPKKIIQ